MGEIAKTEKKDKKFKLIGMRVIKTVVAVYICFLLSFLRENSIPFYSAIAAILSMQNDGSTSWQFGKSRIIGTLIGGIYGFFAILIVNFIGIQLFNYVHYVILSLFLIPIIYTNVYLKTTSSTYISCVVFLSITVSHGGDIFPMFFAFNRIIDTLIGIGVSLGINLIF